MFFASPCYLYQNQAFIKVRHSYLCALSTHTHTNKHNHNPPWHLPVSDPSHPVAWTVSVTMSCALWQFSPSGWSTGPYGAIQGHRAASDEKHISRISNTEFMCPCRSQHLCKITDYKWRQTSLLWQRCVIM